MTMMMVLLMMGDVEEHDIGSALPAGSPPEAQDCHRPLLRCSRLRVSKCSRAARPMVRTHQVKMKQEQERGLARARIPSAK